MLRIAYVGMDVHQDSITAAMLVGDSEQCADTRRLGSCRKSVQDYLKRMGRMLRKQHPGEDAAEWELRCCYKASGCGYVLYRWMQEMNIPNLTLTCSIVASSKIPRKPGDHVKNDRRDARQLARWLRSGDLTEIRVPTQAEEGVRSIVRLRQTLTREIARSKNHLLKFLAARGLVYHDGTNWTGKHWTWMRALSLLEDDQYVLDEFMMVLEFKIARRREVERRIEKIALTPAYREAVGVLRCLRGIDTIPAMKLLAETGDFHRFESPRQLMAYYGLIPGEYSSGESVSPRPITKAGNIHCRQTLVTAARHYRRKPRLSRDLATRQQGQPTPAVAHAWKCQHRLYGKYWSLVNRKGVESSNKAVVAIARELVGFIWALMTGRYDAAVDHASSTT